MVIMNLLILQFHMDTSISVGMLNSLTVIHNEWDGISDHQRLDCLLNHLFRRRSKKTSKCHVIGHCEGNSQVTSEFPSQRASNAENVSNWWLPHGDHFEDVPSQWKMTRMHRMSPGLNYISDIFLLKLLKKLVASVTYSFTLQTKF